VRPPTAAPSHAAYACNSIHIDNAFEEFAMMTPPQHDSLKRSEQKAPECQPEAFKDDATNDLPRAKPANDAVRLLTPAVQRVVEWHRQRAQPRTQTHGDEPSEHRPVR
jgi:hypothetical protein